MRRGHKRRTSPKKREKTTVQPLRRGAKKVTAGISEAEVSNRARRGQEGPRILKQPIVLRRGSSNVASYGIVESVEMGLWFLSVKVTFGHAAGGPALSKSRPFPSRKCRRTTTACRQTKRPHCSGDHGCG
ncbi:hypothetical protein TNIN_154281 [Trichonephila inaurata madagascariensis]|uniref:Uncharacterized protein n=1 Tax=Trichonephila inaurata madagascariensis TaxID=2747483 RepID=A0A8X7C053_9ARAC|nr:hypothetical protein TNIN_154281 [Trichonephila inaurata madagascariensis]